MGDLLEGIFEFVAILFSGGDSKRRGNSGSTSCKHCGKIAFLVIVGIAAGVIYMQPKWSTENAIKQEAKLLCHDEVFIADNADSWGNDYVYASTEIEDPIATECVVTSLGRDGVLGTDDDIVATALNYHKTKIVGKFVGDSAKSFFSGMLDGIKSDDKPTD